MRSLIRKECGELLAIVAPAFVLLCLLLFGSRGSPITLVVPDEFLAETVFTFAAIAGVVLGYLQFASERWMGRTVYLLHRGTGRSKVFAAKTITGLGSSLLLSIGPLVVFALGRKYLFENGPLVRLDRVVEPACSAAFAVVAYGLGAVAAQVRRHPIAEILLLAVGSFGAVLFAEGVLDSLPENVPVALALFVLVHVVLGAILLSLARRLFLEDVDRELALERSSSGALALFAAPLLVAPVVWVAVSAQGTLLGRARATDATLLRDTDGSTFAVRGNRLGEYRRLDDRGGFDSSAPALRSKDEGASYEFLYGRPYLWRRRGGLRFPKAEWETVRDTYLRYVLVGGAMSEWTGPEEHDLKVFLDRTHHVLRIYGTVERALPGSSGTVRERPTASELGKPPAGSPFSDDVAILRGLARSRPAFSDPSEMAMHRTPEEDRMHSCIVDPADGSLWTLDLKSSPPALVPAALPGGDRFVRLEALYEHRIAEVGRRWTTGFDSVVHGERGTYFWDGREFHDYQPSQIYALKSELESRVGARAVVVATDPLATKVEVRSPADDRVLFAWNYGPRTPPERFCAILAQGITLLRPPLANLVAPARPASGEPANLWYPSAILDPLLAGGARPALLATSLALGLVGALWTWRRLRRRGTPLPALVLWTAVVLLLGSIAHVFARMFEARRAPEFDVEPQATVRRELLIESA